MKKKLKITLLIVVSIIVLYSAFITIEVIRFNKNLGAKPLITITESILKDNKEISYDKMYTGLGYTIKYEYYIIQKENSDHQQIILQSGQFNLFGKLPISMWIQ